MVFNVCILLLSAVLHLILCHPTQDPLKLPKVNISNPLEINNLNYYNADVDSEVGESKLFRRTVSNFEKSVNYLDKTVREVEALINANSTLPRLTRGEILEIIENITQSDLEVTKKNKTKERDEKAIMLVMPYTPQNTDDDKMQELFTKRPVTRIVGEPFKPQETETKPLHKRRRRPLPQVSEGGAFFGEVFPEPLPERSSEMITTKKPTGFQKQRPPVVTQRPLTTQSSSKTSKHEPEIITAKPSIDEISTTEKITQRRSTTTQKPLQKISTEISIKSNTQANASVRRRRPTKTPQRHSNHKYPDEKNATTLGQGIKIIDAPNLKSEYYKNSNVKHTDSTTKKQELFTFSTSFPPQPSQPHHFTTAKPILPNVNLPDELKTTLDELELGDSVPKNPSKFSSPHAVNAETLSSPPPLNDNIRDLLVSIGVLPSTTTTTTIPDISNVADTLTPDMKQLLMSFGLIPDPSHKTDEIKQPSFVGTSTAEIHPDSFVQFKPLPDNGPTRDEMEEFLGRFGLGRNRNNLRSEKALAPKKPKGPLTEVPSIEEAMIPDSMKSVLNDLGLKTRNSKKIRTGSQKISAEQNVSGERTTDKQNVFSPMETQYATQDELEKLNQLLDIIKQLEKLNGTVTEESLNKIDMKNLKDLVGSLNKDQFVPLDEQDWAPNPLNYDYGLSKNEVKRQQNFSAAVSVTVEVPTIASDSPTIEIATAAPIIVTPTIVSSTTEEVNTPNIKDLEDSFGGSSDTKVEATIPPPASTTKAPNTGFYYLLDWNTFLDIDDQKGKRVNLRFQPKAGDPNRFISVTVP